MDAKTNRFIGQVRDVVNLDPTNGKSREKAIKLLDENNWQTVRDVPEEERAKFLKDMEDAAR